MLAPFTHILPLASVIRRRMLPSDGRIRVKVGQRVKATDVLAETIISRKHILLDIARGLRVSPRQAMPLIQFKKGQKVNADQVIAETSGMFAREVRSPVSGRVVVVGGGKLVLETSASTFELLAGLPGIVTEIIGERGVILRASGSLIQGLWGNGQLETGVLMSVIDRPDEGFDPNRLDVSIRNSIILGGILDNPAVIKNAIDLPVRGLIVASLAPALLPLVTQAPFPVIAIEGFGRKPMNSIAFKLLSTSVRREMTLNAASYDRTKGVRPEVFIPLPVTQQPPELHEVDTFLPKQTVRVMSLTGPTRIGTLIKLSSTLIMLSNGLRAKTAEVQLESGEQIVVPLTNLDVLG